MRNNDIISFNVASAIFSVLCSLNWCMWCQIYSYYSNDFKSAPGKKDCTGEVMRNTKTRESKHRKICESCSTQVTWKVRFKCQFCLSRLSCFVLSVKKNDIFQDYKEIQFISHDCLTSLSSADNWPFIVKTASPILYYVTYGQPLRLKVSANWVPLKPGSNILYLQS